MTGLLWFLLVVTTLAALVAVGTVLGPRILCALTGHAITGRRMMRARVEAGRVRYAACTRCERAIDLTRARW